ncbi:hypothetical protein F4677DRAFT_403895 [Hypoxylon crocopeplum]|nr:hypothetical protein F4677DRAFT_403895 [Hypoxylon crocopeplum]
MASRDKAKAERRKERQKLKYGTELAAVKAELNTLRLHYNRLRAHNEELDITIKELPSNELLDQYERENQDLRDWNSALGLQLKRLAATGESSRELVSSKEKIKALEMEIQSLQEFSNESTAYINSVAPYETSVEGTQVQSEFKGLQDNVNDLTSRLLGPFFLNIQRKAAVVEKARESGGASGFVDFVGQYPDVARLSYYPDVEEDVLRGTIMRWLKAHVFSEPLYGLYPNITEALTHIENSLAEYCTPRRLDPEIDHWHRNAYNGIMSFPDYPDSRATRESQLSTELSELLNFLVVDETKDVLQEVGKLIIKPAIDLQERIVTATESYRINFYDFRGLGENIERVSDLFDERASVACQNIANFHALYIEKMTREELRAKLDPICTVIPSFVCSRRSDDYTNNTTVTEVYAKCLITSLWGTPEQREKRSKITDSTSIFNQLLGDAEKSGTQEVVDELT